MNGKQKFYLLLGLFQIVLIFLVIFTSNGIISLVAAQPTEPTTDPFLYYNTATTIALALATAISVSSAVLGSAGL